MNILLESLGDPIWQIGTGILVFAPFLLLLVLRSPEARISPALQQRATRLILLICCGGVLVLSGGVILVHSASASSPAARGVTAAHATLTPTFPLSTPSPSPSPTPIPVLIPSTVQVLTTWCSAINNHAIATVWQMYSTTLQQKLQANTIRLAQFKRTQQHVVHCTVLNTDGQLDEKKASGILMLQTMDGTGYADGMDRPYQLTLSVENNTWKITKIDICLTDGCLDMTSAIVP